MLGILKEFFDDMFQYHYEKLKSKDSDPEVVPIAFLSLSQSANVFFILILLYHTFNLEERFDFKLVVYSVGLVYVLLLAINFYVIVIRRRINYIISRNKKLSRNFRVLSLAYNALSFWSPFLLIYMFNEVWK